MVVRKLFFLRPITSEMRVGPIMGFFSFSISPILHPTWDSGGPKMEEGKGARPPTHENPLFTSTWSHSPFLIQSTLKNVFPHQETSSLYVCLI
jgi:hypothetical protein